MQPSGENDDDFDSLDPRTQRERDFDALAEEIHGFGAAVNRLVETVKQSPVANTQTVIHKTQGMGAVGIVCAAICVLCVLFVMIEFQRQNVSIDGRLRDLEAWRGVHSTKIQALESDIKQLKENRK